ncbi:MAG: flap endonuclease [Thermoplasmata archaeon]|nr:flap endonuclease [Thermoplasmata archaeon]
MGIAALKKLLPTQPFDPKDLHGRTLAVDADNLIWSFATALAASGEFPKAPDGRPVTHLYGLVARLTQYAKWGARSVWVFDGVQPDLKEATLVGRAERIEAARAAGDSPQAMVEVGEEELAECRELLSLLGVPWIVAPGESDAQCAHLARSGAAWAAVTQDWDIALFGAPRTVRNLTLSKTRPPELLDLAPALAAAGLTRERLVDAAILIGTDYNEGVRGVGPVKAVALVRKHGDLHAALAALGVKMPTAQVVRQLFLAHPIDTEFTPRFGKPDEARLHAFLAARGLSAKRGDDLLAAMRGVAP